MTIIPIYTLGGMGCYDRVVSSFRSCGSAGVVLRFRSEDGSVGGWTGVGLPRGFCRRTLGVPRNWSTRGGRDRRKLVRNTYCEL